MESGILVLTQKGRAALETPPPELSPLCRNILVQIDGKKSMVEINTMFRGLKGLEEKVQKLFDGNYIQVSRECRDLVKSLAHQLLGPKAPAFIMKIDEMHTKYGSACWDHLDELDRTARLFYGEVLAEKLKFEIARIVSETNNAK